MQVNDIKRLILFSFTDKAIRIQSLIINLTNAYIYGNRLDCTPAPLLRHLKWNP
jgi:hypothetical protein